jgi:hypothetical protein
MGDLEPQRGVKRDRRLHIAGRQRHRAERFDFRFYCQPTFSGFPVAADFTTASRTAIP